MKYLFSPILFIFLFTRVMGQIPPRVLVVIAHPDDESVMSVTLYKIAKEHHGLVDFFVVTDGEGGYKYSTLAEGYYNVKLCDEADGRKNLPAIRRQELKNAGHILGVSHYFFVHQPDKYCIDERNPLDSCWNVSFVKGELNRVLQQGHYDYVFCLLPEAGEHGAHKAASILALEVVKAMPASGRPVILGAMSRNKDEGVQHFAGYASYQLTVPVSDTALFRVDRTTHFSYNNRLDYKVIAYWELAEHKTQGATQMFMNYGDLEEFWYFKQVNPGGMDRTRELFTRLQATPYAVK
jgi:LmbE family N-acetylglucosaminyl deacetylase